MENSGSAMEYLSFFRLHVRRQTPKGTGTATTGIDPTLPNACV